MHLLIKSGQRPRSLVCTFALMFTSISASAQDEVERPFHGPYVATEVGFQNIFGGALVNGNDVLTESSRFVASGALGWRYQFDNGIVIGIEGQLGITDGNLQFANPATGLAISYENNHQSAYGLTLGYAFGQTREWLIYAYALETSRSFDVTITGPLGIGRQNDNQGMVRYGLGIERVISKQWHLRATAGSLAADFGDANTNIDVEGKLDVGLSLLFQF